MSELPIRPATDADVEGIVSLVEERIGEEDAPEARLVLEDPTYDRRRWTVAVDGSRVVSTMATFPMSLRYGVATVPASMMEFVVTDEAYEGRGLIRRQFDHHHDDLARRGELFQMIVGIPYFYRRFGYEYALPIAGWRSISSNEIPLPPDGVTVRVTTERDIESLIGLQEQAQGAVSVALSFGSELWTFIVRSNVYATLLAETDGTPSGTARLYEYEGDPYVMDLWGRDRPSIDALLADVARRVPDKTITVLERPGFTPLLDGLGTTEPSSAAYYARIGDPAAFLNAVRPELSRRLGRSQLAETEGSGLLSLFASSLRFEYGNGEIGEFTRGGPMQAPGTEGGSGIAPDRFVSLVVGPHGFSRMAEIHPDVYATKQGDLAAVLFPPQTSDVQSWTVP